MGDPEGGDGHGDGQLEVLGSSSVWARRGRPRRPIAGDLLSCERHASGDPSNAIVPQEHAIDQAEDDGVDAHAKSQREHSDGHGRVVSPKDP